MANGGHVLAKSMDVFLHSIPIRDHCAATEMFASVIAFPKLSLLFATYNNNITVLLQLLLKSSIVTAHTQICRNMIIIIGVMRLIEMCVKYYLV